MLDILEPAETMTLARYQDLALAAIGDVLARGGVPFLVGGTPLYVNAVVEGWRLPRVPPDPTLRANLEARVVHEGVGPLVAELRAVDPEGANRAAGNPRRVIRALEVFAATGVPMSRLGGKGPPPYRALVLALTLDRATLYARVDARADRLLAAGLAEEVRTLLVAGISPDAPAMSSIGYRQLVPAILGDMSLDAAVARVKIATHRYIRHQETWLRQTLAAIVLDTGDPGWLEEAAGLIGRHLGTGRR
ncbi:MAG: tRNA (adenosine(37)-N6)-dimethylallyltransferase MiaA [Chloroflexota bacterium]|nr:tRNA (adenosine(37)-N6)-dimethylallyltransferase MiaA [Chloroflexota bacterium]